MKFEYARISDSLFQQEYSLTRLQEYVEMLVYATISFSLPFLLGHEQLLVGAAVNCALVLAALNLKGARLLPVIILPSIGAFLAGLVFGAASPALLYMIPFIWVGNAVLVLCIKYFVLDKKTNRFAALGFGGDDGQRGGDVFGQQQFHRAVHGQQQRERFGDAGEQQCAGRLQRSEFQRQQRFAAVSGGRHDHLWSDLD